MERTYYLYKIVCLVNQKKYIGQTVEPSKRWYQHRRDAANPTPTMVIGHAIKKHGAHNFEYEVIASCKSQDDANELETLLVQQYESHVSTGKGYNVSLGGWNAPKTERFKQMMRDWHASLSPEVRTIIRKKQSDATQQQIAERGHPGLGTKRTDEQKANISAALKALDKEAIYTDEVRQHMSEAHIGIKDSEETKQKKSERAKEAWENRIDYSRKCEAPGCEISGKVKYKIINGIRYCNKHGLRMLRHNRLDTLGS